MPTVDEALQATKPNDFLNFEKIEIEGGTRKGFYHLRLPYQIPPKGEVS